MKGEITRRGAFAAAAGGAVAAASAKSRVNTGYAEKAPSPYYGVTEADVNMPKVDAAWRADQLAKLKRLASGDIRDEDRNYPTDGPQCPYIPLRSVSDAARLYLRDRRYARQWEQRTIKAALDALDNYDKTGILRTLF